MLDVGGGDEGQVQLVGGDVVGADGQLAQPPHTRCIC